MAHMNTISPTDLNELIDRFPDLAQLAAELTSDAAGLRAAIWNLIASNDEVVRHLAAIGVGREPEELTLGAISNMIWAAETVTATATRGDFAGLLAVMGYRLEPNWPPRAETPSEPGLRLVVDNTATSGDAA